MSANTIWIAIGLAGQALFSARFLVQWIYSERKKQSIIPTAFWYLSIGGSLTLLTYAIYRKDPVFIIGQASGFAIYLRNLQFIYRDNKRLKSEKS
ncbi:MAG: lipid-A-disaccharide synthase N-terminal domain-containing protein [Desulfobacterales bacterium]